MSTLDDDMYTKLFKAKTLLEYLDTIKSHTSESLLNKMVQMLHYQDENLYFENLAFPNPNLEIHQWMVKNLYPETIEFLKQKTEQHKDLQDAVIQEQPQGAEQVVDDG